MSPTVIIVSVIVLILFAAPAVATARIAATRRALRERFGDEYDRVAAEQGGRATVEEPRQAMGDHPAVVTDLPGGDATGSRPDTAPPVDPRAGGYPDPALDEQGERVLTPAERARLTDLRHGREAR